MTQAPKFEPSEHLKAVLDAIDLANADGLLPHEKLHTALSILKGYSGSRLIGALQRLCRLFPRDDSSCYLEIGVFQGLTLNHVAAANPGFPCFGIDNFAFFDPDKKNLGIVQDGIRNLNNSNAQLINRDYEDALAELDTWIGGRRVAVYFVDGPHDYRSQLMCLEMALPFLHERAIIVIDDSNYEHVRQANADFLATHKDWALLAEAYTSAHPRNLGDREVIAAEAGWWNGVNILGCDPSKTVPRCFPKTRRSRSTYEADHMIYAHRLAGVALEALRVWGHVVTFSPVRAVAAFRQLIKCTLDQRQYRGRFEEMNTFSEGLTQFSTVGSESPKWTI